MKKDGNAFIISVESIRETLMLLNKRPNVKR